MDNQLTIKNNELAAIIDSHGLDKAIKPLIREIHLFDTFIAGTAEIKNNPLRYAKQGDKLALIHKESKFDDNEIMILDSKNRQLGYVPEKDNAIFARLMDAGKKLIAYITNIEKRFGFYQVSIAIFLVDF